MNTEVFDLWVAWLAEKSIFRSYPAVISLISYLLGIVLWRLTQIRWHWWIREIRLLPYGLIVAILGLWLLKLYWWRWGRLVIYRPQYLVLLVIFLIGGYIYADYQWNQSRFPHDSQLSIRGKLIKKTNLGDTVSWWVRLAGTEKKVIINQPIWKEDIRLGDLIFVKGRLEPFPSARNPGEFDLQRFQRYQLFIGQIWRGEIKRIVRPRYSLYRWIGQGRDHLVDFFSTKLSPPSRALLLALLTGDDSYIPLQDLQKIRALGLSHLLAISGLHLGLISLLVRKLLAILRVPKSLSPVILLSLIWLAVLFVGGQPSALRVGLFLTLVEVGQLMQRPVNPVNLLAVTAWIILLKNPLTVFLLSFQLSFVVYLCIICLIKPLNDLLRLFLPEKIIFLKLQNFLSLSIAAFLGSVPIILYNFYQVSFLGILMNLWAVPLIYIFILLGLSTLVVGMISPMLAVAISSFLDYLISLFYSLLDYFFHRFSLIWQPGRPPIMAIIIFYLSLGLVWKISSRKGQPLLWYWQEKRIVKRFLLISFLLYLAFQQIYLTNPQFELVMLDVGQGDSMFLHLPSGTKILIDGGGRPGRPSKTGERIVKPFLLSRGITEIDLICITHFDADHVQGILTVLRDLKTKLIWMPPGKENPHAQSVQHWVQIKNISLNYPYRGQKIFDGTTLIEILHPVKGVQYPEENQQSLVFRINCAGKKFLFMGDLGESEEVELVTEGWDLAADILKIGHHGSKYSSSLAFLEEVDPEIALISVGRNNYGHPAEDTLDRLRAIQCAIFRTDRLGAISIKFRGSDGFIIHGYK